MRLHEAVVILIALLLSEQNIYRNATHLKTPDQLSWTEGEALLTDAGEWAAMATPFECCEKLERIKCTAVHYQDPVSSCWYMSSKVMTGFKRVQHEIDNQSIRWWDLDGYIRWWCQSGIWWGDYVTICTKYWYRVGSVPTLVTQNKPQCPGCAHDVHCNGGTCQPMQ